MLGVLNCQCPAGSDGAGIADLQELASAEMRMARTASLIRQALRQAPGPGHRGILVLVADRSTAQQYEDYFKSAYRSLLVGRALDSLTRQSLSRKNVTLTTGPALARALQSHSLTLNELSLIVADDADSLFTGAALDADVVGNYKCMSGLAYGIRAGLDAAAKSSLRFPQRLVDEKLSAYSFRDRDLLLRALLHPSKARRIGSNVSYRPLDYVGQFALEFVLLRDMVKNGTLKSNQDLHDARTRLLRQETLARVAAINGLDHYVFLDEGPEKTSMTEYADVARFQASAPGAMGSRQNSFLHNFLQSVAGAVYIDSGYDVDTIERIFLKFFKAHL
ncbi:hypothetical protein HPB49_016642 [Dermacentor silvarum]|uniref:Uncharacterized protein n=1 Tax=Dermacentor silvarum TaxID=543639 RepID=A0ACB8DQG2_DERSI|nr:hypothetical protein HPB49_016642 [Dermacentor silvarum]